MSNNKILSYFTELFLPQYCCGCGQPLSRGEQILCLHCLAELPETHFQLQAQNPVARKLTGRIAFENATACYYFHKTSNIQNIIHHFKYKNKREAALFMGKRMGELLLNSRFFNNIDVIVPVPLHPARKKKRGYNQSEVLGEGVAEILGKPVLPRLLRRKKRTPTQTRLSATDRWQNVKEAFVLTTESIPAMHVLLIDDVITSGATLEACATVLQSVEGMKVSIATLAYADDQ